MNKHRNDDDPNDVRTGAEDDADAAAAAEPGRSFEPLPEAANLASTGGGGSSRTSRGTAYTSPSDDDSVGRDVGTDRASPGNDAGPVRDGETWDEDRANANAGQGGRDRDSTGSPRGRTRADAGDLGPDRSTASAGSSGTGGEGTGAGMSGGTFGEYGGPAGRSEGHRPEGFVNMSAVGGGTAGSGGADPDDLGGVTGGRREPLPQEPESGTASPGNAMASTSMAEWPGSGDRTQDANREPVRDTELDPVLEPDNDAHLDEDPEHPGHSSRGRK